MRGVIIDGMAILPWDEASSHPPVPPPSCTVSHDPASIAVENVYFENMQLSGKQNTLNSVGDGEDAAKVMREVVLLSLGKSNDNNDGGSICSSASKATIPPLPEVVVDVPRKMCHAELRALYLVEFKTLHCQIVAEAEGCSVEE